MSGHRSQGMPTEEIDDDTPLRLKEAAMLAFPNGGMTAGGLRREANRRRLRLERVAGKDYTQLHQIKRMKERCPGTPSRPGPCSSREREPKTDEVPEPPAGLSLMAVANSELAAALSKSKERSKR